MASQATRMISTSPSLSRRHLVKLYTFHKEHSHGWIYGFYRTPSGCPLRRKRQAWQSSLVPASRRSWLGSSPILARTAAQNLPIPSSPLKQCPKPIGPNASTRAGATATVDLKKTPPRPLSARTAAVSPFPGNEKVTGARHERVNFEEWICPICHGVLSRREKLRDHLRDFHGSCDTVRE